MLKTLQDRLREAYAGSGFKSYAALARAAGIKSPSTISGLMRGELGADAPTLVPLADTLNVSAMWLQQGRGPKEIPSVPLTDQREIEAEMVRRVFAAQRLMGEQLKELMTCFFESTPDGRTAIIAAGRRALKSVSNLAVKELAE